jgi:hypothetical protein
LEKKKTFHASLEQAQVSTKKTGMTIIIIIC